MKQYTNIILVIDKTKMNSIYLNGADLETWTIAILQ